ncbi:unnamed protein product [Blepharisma stoltei]|uniref:Histone deacetylase 6 n=1 Tax=Blepharisma stoltei TaxID=1481888 RepID=A0AAU9JXI6_9CILI|nr:unnamed protein product [Blepharisma stoltei]
MSSDQPQEFLGSFGVVPKEDCPHISRHVKIDMDVYARISRKSPCHLCSNTNENWLCLECLFIGCSRYINSHMSLHNNEESHPIAFSFTDCSFWCYDCDSYITSPLLISIVEAFQNQDTRFVQVQTRSQPMDIDQPRLEPGDGIRVDELEKELAAARNARQFGGMYAVSPKYDCPHILPEYFDSSLEAIKHIEITDPCGDCQYIGENWVCLKCGVVKCSRYIKEHMLMHALETAHCLSLSFSDLSFWCYQCESYIASDELNDAYNVCAEKKFGKVNTNTSAHRTEEEKKEYFDSPEELERKIDILAQWIRESSHFMAFTGAGVSTSSGIPDYRSGYGTVLQTGPGAWERKAHNGKKPEKPTKRVAMEKAIPTLTHMSFVKLMQEGVLKYVASQNTDGMHRKSGIPPENLGELHGNTNLEVCNRCHKEYMRDYGVRSNPFVNQHETGQKCDDPYCGGDLLDTIINFGENLNQNILEKAFQMASISDLCLAMGSSLRVTPAANIPELVGKQGRLVIVNLQKTPLDRKAQLVIHAMCDTVMEKLMERLGLEIPQFRLVRRVKISKLSEAEPGHSTVKECMHFQGIDSNEDPYSLFPKIEVRSGFNQVVLTKDPMKLYAKHFNQVLELKLHFQGHYGETPLEIIIDPTQMEVNSHKVFIMVFNPYEGEWEQLSNLS